HAARVEGLEAVDRAEEIRVESRDRPVVDLLDEDLVDELLRARDHLTAAEQLVLLLGNRLEAPTVAVERVAEAREVERHHLQAALEHEGARHARVVLEVSGEEPVVRRDGLHGAQIAAPPGTARAVEVRDLIEEEQIARLHLRRAVVRLAALEALAEASVDVAVGDGADLL